MKDHRQQLINQVSGFTNEELLRLLEGNQLDYRLETITYAKAEANKRGLSYFPAASPAECHQTNTGTSSKFKMLLRSNIISVCVGIVLAILIVINYFINARILSFTCYDCAIEYGFPFAWYVTEGFASAPGIIWSGIIMNVAISSSLGFSLGWLCKKKWRHKKRKT